MKPSTLTFLLLVFVAWPTASMAGDWYVHRTSHNMSVPPWYCYCYRVSKASVLPGTVTYPMDMQISEGQAFSKLATYSTLPETCANNCGFGTASPGTGGGIAGPPPPQPPPSAECQELAKVGGCTGFCKGMIAGYEDVAGVSIAECIANCREKSHCER